MNSFRDQIISFFQRRIEVHPEVLKPSSLGKNMLLGEEDRARLLLTISNEAISVKTGTLYSGLLATIYRVFAGFSSVILAKYEDQALLWLDDHSDNTDYNIFLNREHLSGWLSHDLDGFVRLLVETKFHFLREAYLVSSVSDVPRISEHKRQIAIDSGTVDEVIAAERRLESVADQVHPPIKMQDYEGSLRINFYIWVRTYGRLVRMDVSLGGPDASLQYEGRSLAVMVGDYVIPR